MSKQKGKTNIPEVPDKEKVKKPQKLNLDTFSTMKKLDWMVIARLKHLAELGSIPNENTIEGWKKIIKRI
jgi:uncharacterized protein YqcC (DUF446 family)